MTEPTDDELEALLVDKAPILALVGGNVRTAVVKAMREAFDKWGTPPAVAGEPVALLVRKNSWRDGQWEAAPPNSPSYGLSWANQRVYVYPTPQPAHAQAGTVPLKPEQVVEIADAAHREYDRLVASGQCAPRWSAVFAHLLEQHHGIGIKGGQHG